MAIPENIIIKNGPLPPRPGVYFMRDKDENLLYIGKATSLRSRVGSYFSRPSHRRIAKMVSHIAKIEFEETSTSIEALMREAILIKKEQPPYNIAEKDDKSFVHLLFTKEEYPRPILVRGHELARMKKGGFLKVFGPFTSINSVQAALDALRKAFPWTVCRPGQRRPCFYRHLHLCPGVCTREISSEDYNEIIRGLMGFFEGKRRDVLSEMKEKMQRMAKEQDFEGAAMIRDRLSALEHVRDIAVMKKDDGIPDQFVDIFGRIEGYDISNTGGKDAVGSMVVFRDGVPQRSAYRLFRIKESNRPDDVAMLSEMFRRRIKRSLKPKQGSRSWPLPTLILVDGGVAQCNVVKRIVREYELSIPVIGVTKGPDRKQDKFVYEKDDQEIARLTHAFKLMLLHLRDEAHRFAVSYHRRRRGKRFLIDI